MLRCQIKYMLMVVLLMLAWSCEQSVPCYFKSPPDYLSVYKGDTVYIAVGAEDVIENRFDIQLYINDELFFDTDYGSIHYEWPTRYEKPGMKRLIAIVTDREGRSRTLQRTVIVLDPKLPVIGFESSVEKAFMFEKVKFTDLTTNTPYHWRWEFGDGFTSSAQHPQHEFKIPGTFDVRLTCWNKYGHAFDTKHDLITIEPKMVFRDRRDQKEYIAVSIGEQWWMGENLAFLPEVSSSTGGSSEEAHYYVYGADGPDPVQAKSTGYYQNYGVLYNLPAAKAACPDGWHLPTLSDWEELASWVSTLNGGYVRDSITGNNSSHIEWWMVGTHLRSVSYDLGLDDVGFNALPGGYLVPGSRFSEIGEKGHWWGYHDSIRIDSITFLRDTLVVGVELATNLIIQLTDPAEESLYSPENASSVRCVKDTTDLSDK